MFRCPQGSMIIDRNNTHEKKLGKGIWPIDNHMLLNQLQAALGHPD